MSAAAAFLAAVVGLIVVRRRRAAPLDYGPRDPFDPAWPLRDYYDKDGA